MKSVLQRTWMPQTYKKLTEIPRSEAIRPTLDLSPLTYKSKGPCQMQPVQHKEPFNAKDPPATIVFTSLSNGQMCSTNSPDWRRSLPYYIGRFLSAKVIIYGHHTNSCHYCYHPNGENATGCVKDVESGVDALVVVGSGQVLGREHACKPEEGDLCQQQYFDLWQILSRHWAKAAKQLVMLDALMP